MCSVLDPSFRGLQMNKDKLQEFPYPSLTTSCTSPNEGSMHVSHMSPPPTPAHHLPALPTPQICLEPQKKSRMTGCEHSQAPEVTTAIAQPISICCFFVLGVGGVLFTTTADGIEDGEQEMSARSPRELPSSPPCNNKHGLVLESS